MNESQIKSRLAALEIEMTKSNALRDGVIGDLRKLAVERTELEAKLKLIALPASPLKAHVLAAAGITSQESVSTGK